MWGVKYIGSRGWLAEFLERAAAGTLPAVSFVDPIYTVLDDGTGNDDHPHADIRNGDAFLAAVFHAVAGGPAWETSMNGEAFSSTWHPCASQRRITSIQTRSPGECLASGCQRSWFLPLHATRPERPR